ncbi:LOW QUALITY PROTEIN: uncharacterized protein EMH_0071880 [Eimeria mitis]|uniref:Uncharacterized protein n=1 Tax=Eimeria mitis TaxID=44415 RepID=U6K4Y8_9EIME|nr:LOW QUALITY PROTEIN: uncharacterized protein EMH_0071880 [Eimeria mitis]CDJ32041.1 hypothetical protein EMH_0071880 [Eimeria mitis]
METQFLDEETPSQSLSTGESAAAGPSADPSTFGLTAAPSLRPGEDTASSTSPVEGSPESITVSLLAMPSSSDSESGAQGAIILQPEGFSAVQAASKTTVLFKYIVGKPGTKGAYMLLGSEISSLQVRCQLLKQPMLDSEGLDCLMKNLEQLLQNALNHGKENISGLKPRLIVERLAFALLVTDALFAASEVLGPAARRSECRIGAFPSEGVLVLYYCTAEASRAELQSQFSRKDLEMMLARRKAAVLNSLHCKQYRTSK